MNNGEIYRFDGTTIEYVAELCISQQFFESVYDIYEDSNSSLWVSGGLGLCHYSNGQTTTYTSSNSDLSNSFVTSIDKDSAGNIWVGTYGGGVNMFDGLNWVVYNMLDIGLFSNRVISIHVDKENSVWAGTEGGLARFINNQWIAYSTQNSKITGNVILSIKSDSDNTIYIGTKFNSVSYTGLNIFKNGEWNAFSLSNSSIGSNSIKDIEQGNNNDVLIASRANLSKYNASGWERFQAPPYGTFPNLVYDIEFDSENIPWILLVNGLAKFENENFSFYDHIGNIGTYDYLPRTLGIDITDRKWIGTDDEGIYIFNGTSWSNFNISNSALISNNITDIERDINGDMWVACGFSGGLYQIENNNWTHYHNQNTELPQNTSNWVYEIEIDQDNNKYLGTHGLCIFDDPFGSWNIYTTQNSGLPQIDINAIAIEENGTLWIGTGNGLAKLVDGQWTIYNQSNSPITDNAISDILIDSDNNKWIGTSSGGLLLLSDNMINSSEDEEKKDFNFIIAPNPSTGAFRIINNSNHNSAVLEVFNSLGISILSKKYPSLPESIHVEIPNASTGIYYSKISTEDIIELQIIVVSK
ncbi:MAG: T9SS type A sorting domain-containing protein [Saprospiraceae bacterium]|nr:T9SS type A sorting domain-containing protein [Saprospiraceae bacterium]